MKKNEKMEKSLNLIIKNAYEKNQKRSKPLRYDNSDVKRGLKYYEIDDDIKEIVKRLAKD